MEFKNKTFDHSASTLEMGVGVDINLRISAREKIIYATVSNYFLSKEYADINDETPPLELTTSTGDFKKAISLSNNPLEYEYSLLIFNGLHNILKDAVAQYIVLDKVRQIANGTNDYIIKSIETKEKELHTFINNKKISKEEEDYAKSLFPSTVFKRILLIKDNKNISFEDYFEEIEKNNFFLNKKNADISVADEILKNIFNKKEEEN